jgi:L-malate glycosyltransferase
MRILIVGDVYSIHVRRWASYFAPGHDVYIAYLPRNSQDDVKKLFASSERINLVPLGSPFMTGLKRIPRAASMKAFGGKYYVTLGLKELKRAIERIKPDIMHAHYLPDYGWLASQTGFRPLALSAWGQNITFIEREKRGPLSKRMFEAADLVFAGELLAKERLVEFGCPPEVVHIQAWGIDTERFTSEARSEELRNLILGGKKGLIVTFVCSLHKDWEIPTLIRAAPIVLSEMPNVTFQIIGDGPERNTLEKLIFKLGVSEKVKLAGRIDSEDINRYLASSDLYVDTYFTDKAGGGIGVAVMEALSTGLPVVAGRRPGVEAGVKDRFNGYLFEGGSPEDMAKKMLSLLNDEEKRKAFGQKSREIAIQIGDWKKNMAEVEVLYRNAINNRNLKRNK